MLNLYAVLRLRHRPQGTMRTVRERYVRAAPSMAAETPSEKTTQTPSGQTAVQDRPKLVSAKLTSAAVLLAILIYMTVEAA